MKKTIPHLFWLFNTKRVKVFMLAVIIAVGGVFWYAKYRSHKLADPQTLTLAQAARMGEKTTHQLLVQIYPNQGSGRYERGDVVMVAPAEREFSIAEKEGFLIIQMELTEKQSQLLMLAMQEKTGEKSENGIPVVKDTKRRKFAVDFSKIGVGDEVVVGRVIEDKVFAWDALYQKEIGK